MEVNQQDFTSSNCVTGPVINDGISTTSGEDLNQQIFLRMKAKIDELIVLENERLSNELNLVQSQLTDSHSKLQMLQNVHDELATTKSELEKQKSVITDITEINLRLTNDNSRLERKIKDRDRFIALIASAPHWTYVQQDLGIPLQFTPINRTLFEPTKFHGNPLHHNSNTEDVGMRYLSDNKNPNELYPLSLLQELRSNQNSPEKFDLLEKNDNQLKPENPPNPEKSDFKEKKVNQTQVKPKDPHELAQNEEKSDLLEKKDNQSRSKAEERIALPLNPEKDGVLQLHNDNQPCRIPEDPNSEKYDLLEKKFNNKLLELNNKINFLLEQKDPHALSQKPTEKSDLLEKENNQLKHKPEDPQVLGNPKVEQVPETDKKQSIGKNIKKSLLSVKELFQPRKQTELENNPAEKNGLKNEPDVEKSREKCVIHGKTFPIIFDDAFVKSVADYNVWESIGKPKIINKEKWGKFENEGVSIIGETKVNIEVNGKKKKIKILVINKPLEYHPNTIFIRKSDLP